MLPRRHRGKLDWKEVAALRRACVQCGAQPGRPCRNYRGQRKFTCADRLSAAAVPALFAGGATQGELFGAPDARKEGGL